MTLQVCHYSYHYLCDKCSDELCLLVLPVLIFTARTCLVTFTELNHPHFHHITSVKRSTQIFFKKLILYGIGSYIIASLNTSNLTNSSLRSIIIFSHYSHQFHLLPHSLQYTSFSIHLNQGDNAMKTPVVIDCEKE